ncbi:zonular occludens toxin domain-containing protein [Microbulbifer variabilis]|uniref:zonular occludens toxin domain-containing protein n=1 Tax=Microbulbifer variabilis TaxID=266805 RepID=UPI00146A6F65|nr:zonular occludens toxin domain-containing protein [Microbulbifer variabilis]
MGLDVEKRAGLQKQSIFGASGNDVFIFVGEIQNLFPSGREKLNPEWKRCIKHRHNGLDVILMGQPPRLSQHVAPAR